MLHNADQKTSRSAKLTGEREKKSERVREVCGLVRESGCMVDGEHAGIPPPHAVVLRTRY